MTIIMVQKSGSEARIIDYIEKTARLQECLKRYRRSINATTNQPTSPLHDEYSHGADAFRYLATAIDSMRNDNIQRKRHPDAGPGTWMV
jgi:hypothetical protein